QIVDLYVRLVPTVRNDYFGSPLGIDRWVNTAPLLVTQSRRAVPKQTSSKPTHYKRAPLLRGNSGFVVGRRDRRKPTFQSAHPFLRNCPRAVLATKAPLPRAPRALDCSGPL